MNEQEIRNQTAEEIAAYLEWMCDYTYLEIPAEMIDTWRANWKGTAFAIRKKFIKDDLSI
jgi:hypothetical protein